MGAGTDRAGEDCVPASLRLTWRREQTQQVISPRLTVPYGSFVSKFARFAPQCQQRLGTRCRWSGHKIVGRSAEDCASSRTPLLLSPCATSA